jgi:hypothetical protein
MAQGEGPTAGTTEGNITDDTSNMQVVNTPIKMDANIEMLNKVHTNAFMDQLQNIVENGKTLMYYNTILCLLIVNNIDPSNSSNYISSNNYSNENNSTKYASSTPNTENDYEYQKRMRYT